MPKTKTQNFRLIGLVRALNQFSIRRDCKKKSIRAFSLEVNTQEKKKKRLGPWISVD